LGSDYIKCYEKYLQGNFEINLIYENRESNINTYNITYSVIHVGQKVVDRTVGGIIELLKWISALCVKWYSMSHVFTLPDQILYIPEDKEVHEGHAEQKTALFFNKIKQPSIKKQYGNFTLIN
ncbi:hypothetical protein ACJX0J_034693, partial [Zea mays]